jgi:hypothetical protein
MRTGKETASPRGGYYDKDGNYHGPAAAEEVEQKTPEPAAGGDTGLNVPENEAEVRFRDDGRTVAEKLFDE